MDDTFGQLIEPAPVSFHFGAPGWYVVLLLLVAAVLTVVYYCRRYYRRRRYRRLALRQLRQLETTYDQQDVRQLIYQANMLLKKVAMLRYGREQTASLRPDNWRLFLNSHCSMALFQVGDVQLLQSVYPAAARPAAEDAAVFIIRAEEWIKKHI